jgi:hypothetical protein
VRVVLNDGGVSSDEDKPLQKCLQQLSGAGPVVLDEVTVMMATANKEAMDKRAAEEAAA